MVNELKECEYCGYKGVVDVIKGIGTTEKIWECPSCKKQNISET